MTPSQINSFTGKVKTVWFDLDGTLLLSNPQKLKFNFVYHYIRLMTPICSPTKALRVLQCVKNVIENGHGACNYQRAAQAFSLLLEMNSVEGESLYRSLLLKIFATMQECFEPVKDAPRLLQEIRQKWPLVLATNPVWPKEIVEMRLDWARIPKTLFSVMTHAENSQVTKKSPAYYSQLATQTGSDPEDVLHVGNDPQKDLPAVIHGMKVFLLSTNKNLKRHQAVCQALPMNQRLRTCTGNWQVLDSLLGNSGGIT